jgi:hypothetical protein
MTDYLGSQAWRDELMDLLRASATPPIAAVIAGTDQEMTDEEIAERRPGLVAAAVALAAVLDNPRATSSKPAAAGAQANILNQLRKTAGGSKAKLASVRSMTAIKRPLQNNPQNE